MAFTNITNINLASSNSIIATLAGLRSTYNPKNAWQNNGENRYIVDTITKVKAGLTAGTLNNAEVIKYVSTSVFIHCFNGWAYLSSAVNSLLEGDYGNAIHNAYYAELRGIMSFMAGQGVGTFNGANIIIDSTGNVHSALPVDKPTHVFAKSAFDTWLNAPGNANLIFNGFTAQNKSLSDWLTATGFSSEVAGYQASAWLQNWSMDLNVIDTEQKLRNFVSYNPQMFDLTHVFLADDVKARAKFVIDLWNLCSPSGIFADTILRNSLEKMYNDLFSYTGMNQLDVEKDIKPIFTALGKNPNDIQSQNMIDFLRRVTVPSDNLVFNHASNINYSVPVLESQIDPMGIISRACLILLVNTKMIENLIRLSGTTKADLKFWFDSIGVKLGYWNLAAEPYLLSDLWSDVQFELSDIQTWIDNPATVFTPFNFKTNFRDSMPHHKSLSKAYLWNLGL